MEAIIIGWLSAHVAEWAKQHPSIPFIRPDTVALVRLLVAILAVAGNLAAAYVEGPSRFAQFDWATAGRTLIDACGAFVTAELTYQASIKGAQPKEVTP